MLVEDLNMPQQVDHVKFHASIDELLRQYIDASQWYADTDYSPVRMEVHDVTMVANLTFNPQNMLS